MTRKPHSAGDGARNFDTQTPDLRTPQQRLGDSIRTSAQRETVEAFVVAFVLALLFRAFVAEAFVIPTGSMAPTLMGAHKDISCEQCSHQFQIGASKERRGPEQDDVVIGGVCPNCHYVNNMDLAENSNHATFNGDRILVSKFAYTLSDPERWDVIVFKFPGNPKQNYIKRLVGLPNETIGIQYGDVYSTPNDGSAAETMLRKPADKLLAMRHHVYDSDEQSALLIQSNYPSQIQPWRENTTEPPTDSWKIERNSAGLTAAVEPSGADQTHWLRYFHRWPSDEQWNSASQGGSLATIDPYSSRLITDFYPYNCYITVPSREVYESPPSNSSSLIGRLLGGSPDYVPSYQSGGSLSQFGGSASLGERGFADEGLHWVGDLIVETTVSPSSDCKQVMLELVEAGIQYRCAINLQNGNAELSILDGDRALEFSSAPDQTTNVAQTMTTVQGETSARAGASFAVRFSNCDDQLLLWIDDDLVEFSAPTTFDSRQFRSAVENFPHYQAGIHPLDAAPVGIAVQGGAAKIEQVKIDRDKYYVATDNSSFGIFDYDMNEMYRLAEQNVNFRDIQAVMARPDLWEVFPGWQTRRKVTFPLDEDHYFPMGDNSPESLDARCWAGTKLGPRLPQRYHDQAYAFADASYVPRDLLVGKALMVFWPHPWKSPLPVTPNFGRFRLIR